MSRQYPRRSESPARGEPVGLVGHGAHPDRHPEGPVGRPPPGGGRHQPPRPRHSAGPERRQRRHRRGRRAGRRRHPQRGRQRAGRLRDRPGRRSGRLDQRVRPDARPAGRPGRGHRRPAGRHRGRVPPAGRPGLCQRPLLPVPRRCRLRRSRRRTGRAQGRPTQALRRPSAVRGGGDRHVGQALRPLVPRLPGLEPVGPRGARRRRRRPGRGGRGRGPDGGGAQHRPVHLPRDPWPVAGPGDPPRHAALGGHVAVAGPPAAATGAGRRGRTGPSPRR